MIGRVVRREEGGEKSVEEISRFKSRWLSKKSLWNRMGCFRFLEMNQVFKELIYGSVQQKKKKDQDD